MTRRKKLVQASLFPEPPKPKRVYPDRIRSLVQLDMDDALDGFMQDFRWRFSKDYSGEVSIAHRFIKFCKEKDLSVGEVLRRLPRPNTTPEALVRWRIGKDLGTTDEGFVAWQKRHSERRIKGRGGKAMKVGDVLRAAMGQQ